MADTIKAIDITGASSDIGRAMALRLARNGWRVFAVVCKNEYAKAIAADADGALETVRLDIGDNDSIAAAARKVEARLDDCGLDAFFNNAGIGFIALVEQTAPEALRKIFEINIFGLITMIQSFLPLVRRVKGCIIIPLDRGVRSPII